MKRKNITRSALFTSIISLLLCVSMLVGTTFAWFTDSVVSGSNVITSGNLDIEVQYTLDGENWADLNGAKDLFSKGLWEPGHTEVVALRVKNVGSLALKYVANMNILNEIVGTNKDEEPIVLSDILTVSTLTQQANDENGIGDITLMLAYMGENHVGYETTSFFKDANVLKENQELQPGVEHYLFIKVDMAETVGNEANHKGPGFEPSIEFGINILAAQFTYENDSFGNQYDANAEYTQPEEDDVLTISTIDELREAAANGGTYKLMNDLVMDASEPVIDVSSEFVFNLNGFNLDFSAFATRPFEMADGSSFTLNAEDQEIIAGQKGFVNMPNPSTLIINGGKFSGNVAAGETGALVRVASAGKTTVQLNDVDYTTDAKAIALDSGNYTGNAEDLNITVNGGTYETGYIVFYLNGAPSTQIKNATINSSNVGVYLAKNGTGVEIDNCEIYAKTTGVGIAGGGTVYVRNSNVTSDTRAFQVYSSGGTIDITNTTFTPATYSNFITGKTHKSDCVIIIDGVEVYRKAAS